MEPAELRLVELPDLPGDADQVVLFPEGTTAAACGQDGKVQVYKVPSKEVMASFAGFPGDPRLAVSADGKLLAQASNQETRVKVWDVEKRQEVKTLSGHKLPISDLAFSPDGAKLATSSQSPDRGTEGEIKIWSVGESSEPVSLEPKSGITSIAFSPDGNYLASAGLTKPTDSKELTGEAKVWDLKTRQVKTTLTSKMGPVYRVAFSPDGKVLALAERNGSHSLHVANRIRLVDPQTGDEKGVLLGHSGEIHGLAFSPDGMFLASAGRDHLMRIWQVATMSQRCVHELEQYHRSELTFSRRGDRLAVAARGDAESIHSRVWGFEHVLRGRRTLLEWPTPSSIMGLQFSSDGRSVALYSESAGTWVYDTADGKGRCVIADGRVRPAAISPDFASAAVWGETLKLWDLVRSREVHDFEDPADSRVDYDIPLPALLDAAFSRDGRYLVSTHHDGELKIRRLPDGQLQAATVPPEGPACRVALSADGSVLATAIAAPEFVRGSLDGRGPVCIWDMKELVRPEELQSRKVRKETVRRDGSTRPKTALAKAADFYEAQRKERVAAELQSVAGKLTLINVAADPKESHYHELQLNLPGRGDSAGERVEGNVSEVSTTLGVDAVRLKVPGSEPSALLWTLLFAPEVLDCGLIPATGELSDSKEQVVFIAPTWETPHPYARGFSGNTFAYVRRVLDSPSIQPGQEFIVWFAFKHRLFKMRPREQGKDEKTLSLQEAVRRKLSGSPQGQEGKGPKGSIVEDEQTPTVRLSVTAIPRKKLSEQRWAWQARGEEYADVPSIRRTRLFFHGDTLIGIALSPDGSTVASVGVAGEVKLWDVATEKVLVVCSGSLATFSPDGSTLATRGWGDEAASIILWDAKTGKRLRTLDGGHFMAVSALAFSPDGKRLVSGGQDGMVTLWDSQTGRQLWTPAN